MSRQKKFRLSDGEQGVLFGRPRVKVETARLQLAERHSAKLESARRERWNVHRNAQRAEIRLVAGMLRCPAVAWHIVDLIGVDRVTAADFGDQFHFEICLAFAAMLQDEDVNIVQPTIEDVLRQFRRRGVLLIDGGERIRRIAARRVHGMNTKAAAEHCLEMMRLAHGGGAPADPGPAPGNHTQLEKLARERGIFEDVGEPVKEAPRTEVRDLLRRVADG